MENRNYRIAAAAALLIMMTGAAFAQQGRAIGQLKAQAAALGAGEPGKVSTPEGKPVLSSKPDEGRTAVEALLAGPTALKTFGTCDYNGSKVNVPIIRWETGVNIVKDENGREIRQEYKYPIFGSAGGFSVQGDYGLCYQVCHDACGNNVCWPVCTWQCWVHGGEGDPRPR